VKLCSRPLCNCASSVVGVEPGVWMCIIVYFRQLQAAVYSVIMSTGLNTVTSHHEMCQSGQVVNICKYALVAVVKLLTRLMIISHNRLC